MSAAVPALVLENLSYTYYRDFSRVPIHALKDLSLEVAQGESFGFLGPNGAGKTTTIKCILGLIRATSGRAFIGGVPATDVRSRVAIGYVPEQPYFYDNLTVSELMGVYATLAGVPSNQRKHAIATALERVHLAGRDHFAMRSLSKGLMQRVAMAQAIVAKPKLLILDEPFSGLDPIGRQEFRDLFFELKSEGVTLFLCSHVLSDIEFLCERASILVKGELKAIVDLDAKRRESGRKMEVVVDLSEASGARPTIPAHADVREEGTAIVVTIDSVETARAFAASVLSSAVFGLQSYNYAQLNLTQIFVDLVGDTVATEGGSHNG